MPIPDDNHVADNFAAEEAKSRSASEGLASPGVSCLEVLNAHVPRFLVQSHSSDHTAVGAGSAFGFP